MIFLRLLEYALLISILFIIHHKHYEIHLPLDVWIAMPCNNISRMLFEEDIPEDKGLFTFYRQQAEREEQIKREKKLRKKRREEEAEAQARIQEAAREDIKSKSMSKNVESKNYLMPKATLKVLPPRQPKSNPTKQRLLESIVNMGKQIQPNQDVLVDRNYINTLRLRQHSHLLKSRRFREKLNELSHLQQQQTGRQVQMIDQMHIESLHKRNQSEELVTGRVKQVIHSGRGSVQLPDIHKPEEGKLTHRPKKSMKSQLIQQALHSRDRDKIKQIRNYLRYQSPSKEEERQPDELQQELQMDDKSFEVFEFRQQKLLGILKRFRRGI